MHHEENIDIFAAMNGENKEQDVLEIAQQVRYLTNKLVALGRYDLLVQAITVPTLEQLRIEAARGTLSKLIITADYQIVLERYNRVVELSPVHRALYLLFLNHPEGIEFKYLRDYRDELYGIYERIANRMDKEKIEETVNRLTNPLDNAINEKCSRIKAVFNSLMDEYSASYYIISSHTTRIVEGSPKIWYSRLKLITLPRNLVVYQFNSDSASSL